MCSFSVLWRNLFPTDIDQKKKKRSERNGKMAGKKGHQTKNKLFAYFFVNFRETREFQPNKLKRVTLKFSFLCIYIVSYFYNLNSNLLIECIIKKSVRPDVVDEHSDILFNIYYIFNDIIYIIVCARI